MIISPFTPLHFDTAPYSDGLPSRYVQLWAETDEIMVQVIGESGDTAPTATLISAHTGDVIDTITWQSWQMNSGKVVFFCILSGLSVGHYKMTIAELTSDEFIVTDDAQLLGRTTLIQYAMKDNRQREDAVFFIDYQPYFFDFRVPGGFKDSGVQFGVTNEQFTTQYEEVVDLYAREYVTKTFSLGGPEGVPVWYGALLNRLLTCSYVYFDGVRYARNESEVPSMTTLVDGLDSFVFTQVLRKGYVLNATIEAQNRAAIRRVDDTENRIIDNDNVRFI